MLAASSTMSINGLSVTVSVQADRASLRRLFSDSAAVSSDEEFEDLFSHCLLEMPKVLLQAHESVSRSLLIGASEILQDEINVLTNPEEQAA
jgi:hypothetical protein